MGDGKIKRLVVYFTDVFHDGGLFGWLTVLAAFLTEIVLIGVMKSMAMMIPILQDQFDTQTWLVGWMVAILESSFDFAGPFASPLRQRFGIRAVFLLGGSVVWISLIAVSVVPSLASVAFILWIFTGPALGICFFAVRELIGCCFTKSLSTAFAIAMLGYSLGLIIFPPLTQLFLELYGWRGTTMLIGALFMHLVVCGALLKPQAASSSRSDYKVVAMDEEKISQDGGSCQGFCSWVKSVCASVAHTFNLDLFTSASYWLVASIKMLLLTIFTAWLVYFVPSTTESKGFSLLDTTNFVVIFGFGTIAGNLVVGSMTANVGLIGTYMWMGLSLLVTSTNYFIDPWLMSYWSISVNMFIFGIFYSFMFCLIDVIILEIVGSAVFGSAMGWIALKAGIVRVMTLFSPGLIYDILGSYTLAFVLMGGLHTLTVIALLVLAWLQRDTLSTLSTSGINSS